MNLNRLSVAGVLKLSNVLDLDENKDFLNETFVENPSIIPFVSYADFKVSSLKEFINV